jgi:hypothetical protein
VVTVGVFASADLARFPGAEARLKTEGTVHCKVEGLSFVAVADSTRALSAVGRVSGEDLVTLLRAFCR